MNNKPYKLNLNIYILIFVISIVFMIISIITLNLNKFVIISDIVKNISLGCIASDFVALLIEVNNINEKNKKFNIIYKAIYGSLKFSIQKYIEIYSQFCSACDRSKKYRNEKYTWYEWYEVTKKIIKKADDKKKQELMKFLKDLLCRSIDFVNKSINDIKHQKYLLEIYDVYNNNIKMIIDDFEFEFMCAKNELEYNQSIEEFFDNYDAINKDFINYINAWSDIGFYNYLKFKPYEFYDDIDDVKKAIFKYSNNK